MHNDPWANDDYTLPSYGARTEPHQSPVRPGEIAPQTHPTALTSSSYYNQYAPPPPPPAPDSSSAYRGRARKRRSRGHRGMEWAWVVIAAALLGVVVIVSMSVSVLLRTSQEGIEVLPTAVAALPTPVDARTDLSALGGSFSDGQHVTLVDGRSIILQPWNGSSRFTVLVVGLDRRPGETGLSYRTDTMMLVSIDPQDHTMGILSIPRDLFVEVPGYNQLQRINTPMVLGELQQPGYGPSLAMQTVQYNLGIRVHDYIAVDFNAFTTIIDAIGGIDIDIPYDIVDYEYPDMNFGYDPLILSAGPQHLDGNTALKYSRTRHGDNDFRRAERQQSVLYAIRDRILDMNMLPQLIMQSPTLLSSLSQNVYTGLSLDRIIQLAWYVKDIPRESIRTGVIDGPYIMNYTTAEGWAVLVPRRAQLGTLMTEVFGPNYSE